MEPLVKGRYLARQARDPDDIRRAQSLRHLAFAPGQGPARDSQALERDTFDAVSRHMLIEEAATGRLLGCFRWQGFVTGQGILQGYAAQSYDLTALSRRPGPMIELGRFCLHPDHHDPDLLRLAWGALARLVDATGAGMLFGCTSFAGLALADHAASLALLRDRHLAPADWRPAPRAPEVIRLADLPALTDADRIRGQQRMPPLLRSYLAMGGRVSDHAVVDRGLNTLHVLTGLEVAAIPAARARALRAVAAEA